MTSRRSLLLALSGVLGTAAYASVAGAATSIARRPGAADSAPAGLVFVDSDDDDRGGGGGDRDDDDRGGRGRGRGRGRGDRDDDD